MILKKIGFLVGSLRRGSYSKKLAKTLATLLPCAMQPVMLDISQLPLFNDDLDVAGPTPAAWVTFREQVDAIDAMVIVTPEYNRSIPGVLKNAMDIGSRPGNHFYGKPALVVSNSIGSAGGYGANHHLRQTFTTLNIIPVQRPEMYIGHTNTMFDEHDLVKNQGTLDYLQSGIRALVRVLTLTSLADSVNNVLEESTDPLSLQLEPGHFFHKDDNDQIVAEVKFEYQDDTTIVIKSTVVDGQFRGKGIARQLIARVITFAQVYDLKIVPECSYAKAFFEKNPEYANLLR